MHASTIFPLPLFASTVAAAAGCTSDQFTALLANHPEATVKFAEAVPQNGSFGQGPTNIPFPTNATRLPALCAVGINVKSSENSSYNFGLFLPDQGWNERFMTTGNGGFGGGINWPDMGRLVQYGFATMSTDTGHSSGVDDGSWGLNAPETLIDWGYRAMHGSVVLSKEIITSYYSNSSSIKYSYYAACSTGGRQGLREVQLYPDSFDGISVGAPAWWSTHLSSSTLWLGLSNTPDTEPKHIDTSLFPVIVDEMTKQCDPQDGVVDGIVSDPYGCNFDFAALLCTAPNATSCLTAAQLTTVYKFYNDWVDANQTYVFPGVALGADPTYLLGSVSNLGTDYFRYFLYGEPDWDKTQFNYRDVQAADAADPGNATADAFDMTPFKERGGKILKYHGTADSLIPTGSSIYFYNKVVQTLRPKGVNIDDFYRFFLVPGMGHCSGTTVDAPYYLSGGSQQLTGATHSVPGYEDADHDIILALMRWVEQDTAPEKLIASKFVNDTASLGVQVQRPLCVYPKQAKYVSGDVNVPESWECKEVYES